MDLALEVGSVVLEWTKKERALFINADSFRTTMRQLAGSVAVIATEMDGRLYGFTATAVCSVCADPPTILIAVNKAARTHPQIDQRGMFSVNVLGEDQKEIAEHFAGKGNDQFSCVKHRISKQGIPIVEGTVAHLECE